MRKLFMATTLLICGVSASFAQAPSGQGPQVGIPGHDGVEKPVAVGAEGWVQVAADAESDGLKRAGPGRRVRQRQAPQVEAAREVGRDVDVFSAG